MLFFKYLPPVLGGTCQYVYVFFSVEFLKLSRVISRLQAFILYIGSVVLAYAITRMHRVATNRSGNININDVHSSLTFD